MAYRHQLLATAMAVASLALQSQPSASAEPSGACALPPRLVKGDYTHRSDPPQVWNLKQIKSDGSTEARTFNVYVPTKHATGAPLPLVIELHGTNAGAWLVDRSSRMRDKGEREGFIVLQPDSLPAWTTSVSMVLSRKLSDVDFITELLGRLDLEASKLCFDRRQIFVTGGSAGGSMATVLACASALDRLGRYKIAAIAPVIAAPDWPDMRPPICPKAPGVSALIADPVPMRVITSNNDKLVAFGYAGDNVGLLNARVRGIVEAWAGENGCSGGASIERTGRTGWGVLVETITYRCSNVAGRRGEAVLDIFDTGAPERSGHFAPGGPGALDGEYQTTNAIWEFFRTHAR